MDWIIPLAAAALVMFVLFRRVRRLFTRQRYSVTRIGLRLALIGGICVMLFLILSVAKGWVPAAGLGIGTVVGLFGMLLTRFDSTDDELHYTPNAYVGVAVLSLLLARLVYRFSQLENLSELTHPEAGNGFKGLSASPLTVGILFVILGFYLSYYAAVLVRGWALRERSSAG